MRWLFLLLGALLHGLALADEAAEARKRGEPSPHGPMLERILPPTFASAELPEPGSEGARLTLRYCVQCHNLANPAMHNAGKWPAVIERMGPRMDGKGNLGQRMPGLVVGRAG